MTKDPLKSCPYVPRRHSSDGTYDDDLFKKLSSQEYCYLRSSPKTGKTWFLSEVINRLRQNGTKCAIVSLAKFNDELNEWNWNQKLILSLAQALELSRDTDSEFYKKFSSKRSDLRDKTSEVLERFISEVVLSEITSQVVIVFDDVDSLGNAKFLTTSEQKRIFKKSFFETLFFFHGEVRSDFPEDSELYSRLTVTLSGSRLACDLVDASTCDFFNKIFPEFLLQDFSQDFLEADLVEWIRRNRISPTECQDIFDQTKGHPTLTVQLFDRLLHSKPRPKVTNLISDELISQWRSHLGKTREELVSFNDGALIDLYDSILRGSDTNANPDDLTQQRLVASGVAVWEQSSLKIHNLIFQKIANSSSASSTSTSESDPTAGQTHSDSQSTTEQGTSSLQSENLQSTEGSVNLEAETREESSDGNSDQEVFGKFRFNAKIFCATFLAAVVADRVTGISVLWLLCLFLFVALEQFKKDNPGGLSRVVNSIGSRIANFFRSVYFNRILIILAILVVLLAIVLATSPKRELAIETKANKALTDFSDTQYPKQLEAMLTGIQSGYELQKFENEPRLPFLPHRQPTSVPLLALQYIHSKINERNHYKQEIGIENFFDIAVSPQGIIAAAGSKPVDDPRNDQKSSGKKSVAGGKPVNNSKSNQEPSGNFIVVWGTDGTSRQIIDNDLKGVKDMSFSKDGQYLVASGRSKKIKIWRIEQESKEGGKIRITNTSAVSTLENDFNDSRVDFSEHRKYLAATASDGSLKIWKLTEEGEGEATDTYSLKDSNNEDLQSNNLAIINEQCLITTNGVAGNNALKVWRVDENKVDTLNLDVNSTGPDSYPLDYSPTSITVAPNSDGVIIAGRNSGKGSQQQGTVDLWNFDKTEEICTFETSPKSINIETKSIAEIRVDKDGKRLLVATSEGGFEVLHLPDRETVVNVVNQVEYKDTDIDKGKIYPYGKSGRFVTSTNQGFLRLWDLEGKTTQQLKAEAVEFSEKPITKIISHPKTDSKPEQEQTPLIVDGDMYTCDDVLTCSPQFINRKVTSLDGSSDLRCLAIGTERSIDFEPWGNQSCGYKNMSLPLDFSGEGGVIDLKFTPKDIKDYDLIVSSRKNIQLWKISDKKMYKNIYSDDPAKKIKSIEISPDGNYLAAIDENEHIQMWNLSMDCKAVDLSSDPKDESVRDLKDEGVRDIQFYPNSLNNKTVFAALLKKGNHITFRELNEDKVGQEYGRLEADDLKPKNLFADHAPAKIRWEKMKFKSDGYLAVGGEGEVLVWDLSRLSLPKETPLNRLSLPKETPLNERLVAFWKGDWGKITSLGYDYGDDVIVGSESGKLLKLKIGKLENLLTWSCEWLEEYQQFPKRNLNGCPKL